MSRALLLAAMLAASAPAAAEVVASAPDSFTLRFEAVAARPPAETWAALADWSGWWPDAHSYSGKASNLSFEAEADGELEEEWDGGSASHGEVVLAMPPKLLRLHAAFGPLQALPVAGVLEFALAPDGQGTRVTMTYRVGGPASARLDSLAAPVNAVFAEAFARLLVHTPPPPDSAEPSQKER